MSQSIDKGKEKVLLFYLENDSTQRALFSINALKVREIVSIPEITGFPGSPSYIKGLISHRGDLVPAVSLGEFIHLNNVDQPHLLIVVEYGNQLIGFLVKDVFRVLDIDKTQFEQAKDKNAHILNNLSTYVCNVLQIAEFPQLIQVLDLEKIILSLNCLDQDSSLSSISALDTHKKVVVIDDSVMSRSMIKKVLEKSNLHYYEAEDGMQGSHLLQKIKQEAHSTQQKPEDIIGLILIDAEMPHKDGYTLAKEIKADSELQSIPLVMHTALNNATHFNKVKDSGIDHCLLKFDISQLAGVITSFIR